MPNPAHAPLRRDLGGGLLLRQAEEADVDAVARMNAAIHGEACLDPWTRRLMSGLSPFSRLEDFTVVEDTAAGAVVSTLCLLRKTWSYGGVELPIGQVELVGTLPEYRRRGLVRAQMEAVHARSEERGDLVQVIEGIPYYYRQFGYEMGLDLLGGRSGLADRVPALPEGQEEPYTLRPAVTADIPLLLRLDEARRERSLVSCVRRPSDWEYELGGRDPQDPTRSEIRVIEDSGGQAVGLLAHWPKVDDPFSSHVYELAPGASWLQVTPSVLRYLKQAGEAGAEEGKPFRVLPLRLGTEHPCYAVLPEGFDRLERIYAFYVRVPDLPRFLSRVAPVLERRLARSPTCGYTGDLKLSLYRGGVRLRFAEGRLAEAAPLDPDAGADAAFPYLSLLSLLFGRKSLEEIRAFYPDCWASRQAAILLEVLFPKQASHVWNL